jgi:hypothetical protein
MSHANLLLYAKATPDYTATTGKDAATDSEDPERCGSLDYDNPDNFTDQPERSRI